MAATQLDELADPLEVLQARVAQVAHDLSNALGAVLNYAEFLSEDLRSTPAAQAYLPHLVNAARRAIDLVDSLGDTGADRGGAGGVTRGSERRPS